LKFCQHCKGTGEEYYISIDKLIPDETKSLAQGAVSYFNCGKKSYEVQLLTAFCSNMRIDMNKPFFNLPKEQQNAVIYGKSPEQFEIKYKTPSGRAKKHLFILLVPMPN